MLFQVLLVVICGIMFELAGSAQSSGNAFHIATYIDIQVNSADQGVALIKQYRDFSRKDGGLSIVDVVQDLSRRNQLVIVEAWKDQASFDAHERAEHTTQFRGNLKGIHNSPYDQRVHQGLSIDPRPWPAARDTVSVVTHVDVPPNRKDDAEALLKHLAEESRKDEGNLRYDILQQTAPRTNHFTMFAVWKDRKTLDAHDVKAHTRQFRETLSPMLGAPYDERLYKPIN